MVGTAKGQEVLANIAPDEWVFGTGLGVSTGTNYCGNIIVKNGDPPDRRIIIFDYVASEPGSTHH